MSVTISSCRNGLPFCPLMSYRSRISAMTFATSPRVVGWFAFSNETLPDGTNGLISTNTSALLTFILLFLVLLRFPQPSPSRYHREDSRGAAFSHLPRSCDASRLRAPRETLPPLQRFAPH